MKQRVKEKDESTTRGADFPSSQKVLELLDIKPAKIQKICRQSTKNLIDYVHI